MWDFVCPTEEALQAYLQDRTHWDTLLDTLLPLADAFSLSVHDDWHDRHETSPLREALRPHFVGKFETPVWYGWRNTEMTVFVYRYTSETRALLADAYTSLFLTAPPVPHPRRAQRPPLPLFEDLCFYRDKALVLGTVSHEYMAGAHADIHHALSPCTYWQERPDDLSYALPFA